MSVRNELSQYANLFSAVDAVRNWRAAALALLTLALAGVIFGIGGVLSSKVHALFGALFFLLGVVVMFYGGNAVGIMLMDEARGGTSRPMLAALLSSLAMGHRLVLVMLMVGVIYLLGVLAIVMLLFLCKLPGIGPLLFTFVFPVCAVVTGIAVFAFYAVIVPLASPAVWSGATTMQSLSRLAAIARQRVVSVILSMIVLLLLVGAIGGIVAAIMGTGTFITGTMSAGIINTGEIGLAGISSLFQWGLGGGGGYLAAGALGGGVVWAVALTLPALVYLRGCCQVYLAHIDGVNVDDVEQQVRSSLNDARRKAEEIRVRGESLAASSPSRSEPSALAKSPAGRGCPVCSGACAPDDMFCGSCGHKLA